MNCTTILKEFVSLHIFQITQYGWCSDDAVEEPDHDKLAWVLVNADSLNHPTVKEWLKHKNVQSVELLDNGLLTPRELLKEHAGGVDYFIPDHAIEFNQWLETGKKKEKAQ